jgi:tripartite-type tricarboxylate transporter receptor subunit TctC
LVNILLKSLVSASALLMALAWPMSSVAQTYPTKPIRVIVPFTAGDLADVIARLLGEKLGEELGQPLVVENRPGASGLLGLQAAMQQPADGYTLVMGQMGGMAVAPNINRYPFDVHKEFVAVAGMYSNYMLLVSSKDFQPKTVPEIIAYSKANPGKVRVATNGEGGFPHLAIELLKASTGLDYTPIPYKGSAQIPADVMSGRVELTILGYSSLMPYVKAGKMNAIAVTGKARPEQEPGIPTFAESVPGYQALGWFGLFARKDTPPEVISKLNTAVNKALAMPDIAKRAHDLGLDLAGGSPHDFQVMWDTDYAKWGKLIHDLHLEPRT